MAATPGIKDGDDVSKLFMFDTRLGPTEDTEHEKVRSDVVRRLVSPVSLQPSHCARASPRFNPVCGLVQILFYYPASATLDQQQSDVGCVILC